MSLSELSDLLLDNKPLGDNQKSVITGLFRIQANLEFQRLGMTPEVLDFHEKVISLFLLWKAGDIGKVVETVVEYDIPVSFLLKVHKYYLICAQYDKAEDYLFHLKESSPELFQKEAESFYFKLATLSEEKLASGGFSSGDIAEGQESLRAFKASLLDY